MRYKLLVISCASFCFVLSLFISLRYVENQSVRGEKNKKGHALEAFEWWYGQRALPNGMIPSGAFQKAAQYAKTTMRKEKKFSSSASASSQWISMGPTNIGGRTLAIAVNPSSSNIVWAGSASGGLWKSTTGGEGTNAWSYVNTGFPTLSVSAILIDPNNANVIYIGTGELSFYHRPLIGTPGARASYGMGILKSTDGGTSWIQTGLTYTFPEITAIQKIIYNPDNTNTLYTATSEGTFKSNDAGMTWTQVHSVLMTIDIVIDPSDTTVLYNSCGNYNSSPDPGLYKSTDAGATWTQLTNGLPSTDFGRTALSISPTNPQIVYAGISNASSQGAHGLFRTTDGGTSWSTKSTFNYVNLQGWYNNVVAVHPLNPDIVFCSGYSVYRSTTGGTNLLTVAPGTVHVDHHAITIDPTDSEIMYFGTDGGIYKSKDGGDSYLNLNNGYVTTQFYPGFANSALDSVPALGGLQDNGTVRYSGNGTWSQVYGGDGGWCAIDPTNNSIMYAEYVWLDLKKSVTGGNGFSGITNGLLYGPGNANFIAPFVISPSNPSVLYAGSKNVYKTTTGGNSWFSANGNSILNGTNVSCIGVSRTSSDTLIAATGEGGVGVSPLFQAFRSTNGGQSWSNTITSLPNRYPTDIEFDPTNSSIAYITYSGYGTPHVFKSTNAGLNWTDVSANLPDIPHQSVVVDSIEPKNIYVGTDLGVYHSSDAGESWEDFSSGMPPAMVLDVTISRKNDVLRASTFGNGVYQRQPFRTPTLAVSYPNGGEIIVAGRTANIKWDETYLDNVKLEFSSDNGATWSVIANNVPANSGSYAWTIPSVETAQARLRVSDAIAELAVDSSDGAFSIIVNPDIEKGWNLVSVDVLPVDASKNVLFPTSTTNAFGFTGSYEQADTLQSGSGYWLRFSHPQHISLTGDSVLTDTIDVTAGWNLIGSVSKLVDAGTITALSPAVISSPFWSYYNGYITSGTIKPKHGYWVKINNGGKLVLTSSLASPKRFSAEKELSLLNSIIIQDYNGHSQTLYFGRKTGRDQSDFNRYELPPIAPSGIFDARFGSQRAIELLSDQAAGSPIEIRSAVYPLTVQWNVIDDESPALIVNGSATPLSGIGTISITQASDIRLELTNKNALSVPDAFELRQNYPNPFNPVTNFEFRISKFEFISLKIYDILGKEVATLLNETKQPGTYSVSWNAEGFASGIYFCRLTAGNFVEVKKMVLLR